MSALIYGNGKLRLRFSNAKNRVASNEIIVATIGTIIGVQILDEPNVRIVPLVTWPQSRRDCSRREISVIS
jgi:hypothetical protein